VAALGVVLAVGFRASTARADPSFALAWREGPAPTACVTEAALREVVAEKLGRDPFTARERADIVIEGEESSAGGRLRARIRERGRDGAVLGSREVEAESCPRLVRATGIVVALFAKAREEGEPEEHRGGASERAVEREVAEPERNVPTASPPAPNPPLPRERPPRSAPPRPLELSLGLGASAALGLLPSASAALRAIARLERARSRWSFEWTAGYSVPQSFRSQTVRGTLSAFDQQVRMCLASVRQLHVRLDVCGGAFWGAVIPYTAGLTERNETWRPLAGPVGALAVQLRAESGRAMRLELGAAVPVVGRTLYFHGIDGEPERVHATGTVIVFLGLNGLTNL